MVPYLLGIGNPLLDIIKNCDEAYLKKYKLVPGGFRFWSKEQEGIYDELSECKDTLFVAGGCTQNSIRMCQGLMKKKCTAFIGCIGNDHRGSLMVNLLEKEGVKPKFMVKDGIDTGVCGVCVGEGGERSMCTYLGAANHYAVDHVKTKETWLDVDGATLVYSSGFFLTVSVESMKLLSKHCSDKNKMFASNLSAPFIVEAFREQMMEVMPFIDILFGNETEWETFGKVNSTVLFGEKELPKGTSLEKIAEATVTLPKENKRTPRICVVTQGSAETIVSRPWKQHAKNKEAQSETLVMTTKYPVRALKPDEIVDTTGAGDGFVAGFLAGLLQSLDVDACVEWAHAVGRHVVKRSGATFDFAADDCIPEY